MSIYKPELDKCFWQCTNTDTGAIVVHEIECD